MPLQSFERGCNVHFLYQLTFSNGKVYIGQTVRSMHIRLSQHRTAANRGNLLPVYCAWRKYGEPSVTILGEYDTPDALHEAEIAAIAEHGTRIPNGYNIAFGGKISSTKCPEVARKISEKAKGRKIDNTERRKEIARGLWQSDEYKKAQSEAQSASWVGDNNERRLAARERMNAVWAKRRAEGWKLPEETKAKLRAIPVSEETRAKMSAAAKGRKRGPMSEETRMKISAKTKAAWQDKELSEKRVAAIRKARGS